jgi:hypothetical protein
MGIGHGRTTHRDRHGMLAGVARLQAHLMIAVVIVVVARRPIVVVCSEPMMVIGMIVFGVGVGVQRRDVADS